MDFKKLKFEIGTIIPIVTTMLGCSIWVVSRIEVQGIQIENVEKSNITIKADLKDFYTMFTVRGSEYSRRGITLEKICEYHEKSIRTNKNILSAHEKRLNRLERKCGALGIKRDAPVKQLTMSEVNKWLRKKPEL